MDSLFSTRLKNRRLELKLSQKELAEGICEQGQISRMEKGKYNPGSELLHTLARRLNVSMDYFFDETVTEVLTDIKHFRILTRKSLDVRDYDTLKYLYDLEIEKHSKLGLKDQLYLEWIGILVLFYCDHQQLEATNSLESLLSSFGNKDVQYFTFFSTLLSFYFIQNRKEKYESYYDKLINQINILSFTTQEELELLLRVRHNFCRYLWLEDKTERLIEEVTETITICHQHHSLYLLPDMYCLLGNAAEKIGDSTLLKDAYRKSQFLYDITGNQKMSLKLSHYMLENNI